MIYAGTVALPTGEQYVWQMGAHVAPLLEAEPDDVVPALSALGHRVRILLLQAVLAGRRTVAELEGLERSAPPGSSTTTCASSWPQAGCTPQAGAATRCRPVASSHCSSSSPRSLPPSPTGGTHDAHRSPHVHRRRRRHLPPAAASAGSRSAGLAAIVEEVAAAARAELGLAGLAVGVVSPHGTHVAGAGDAGGGRVPTGSTLFQIASVTKTFTAARAGPGGRGGAPATGRSRAAPPPRRVRGAVAPGVDITLEHLATATSGLPRLPPGIDTLPGFDPRDPYAHVTLADVAAAVRATTLRSTLGALRVLQLRLRAAGHRAGTCRGDELRRGWRCSRIAEPLDLADTVVTRNPAQTARSAAGHDAQGQPAPDWHMPAVAGAGALWSTADDLLRYLRAHLSLRPGRLAPALRSVRRARARVDRSTTIGLAWFRSRQPGAGPIAWHNGIVGGHAGYVAFAPRARLGVAVLTNTARPVDEVGIAVLRALARRR